MKLQRELQAVCSVAAIACALIAMDAGMRAHPRESQVAWTTDIAPIVRMRCAGCHVEGGYAPMSLTSYEQARQWGAAIATEVLERRMPPWSAAPGFANYANDRSLSPVEIDMLVSWGMGGTPRGPDVQRDQLVSTDVRQAASAGADLVVTAPLQNVTATVDSTELPLNLRDTHWLAGWQFTPGNAAIISHAVISILPGGVLGTWTPGERATRYHRDVGMRIDAASRIRLKIHYRRSGRSQRDSSSVALWFHRGRPRQRVMQSFPCGTSPIARDVEVLSVTPRAAAARASLEVVATRPDGTIMPLSIIPSYHPLYPQMYRFRDPIKLPRDSRLHVRSSEPECSADVEIVGTTRAR